LTWVKIRLEDIRSKRQQNTKGKCPTQFKTNIKDYIKQIHTDYKYIGIPLQFYGSSAARLLGQSLLHCLSSSGGSPSNEERQTSFRPVKFIDTYCEVVQSRIADTALGG